MKSRKQQVRWRFWRIFNWSDPTLRYNWVHHFNGEEKGRVLWIKNYPKMPSYLPFPRFHLIVEILIYNIGWNLRLDDMCWHSMMKIAKMESMVKSHHGLYLNVCTVPVSWYKYLVSIAWKMEENAHNALFKVNCMHTFPVSSLNWVTIVFTDP